MTSERILNAMESYWDVAYRQGESCLKTDDGSAQDAERELLDAISEAVLEESVDSSELARKYTETKTLLDQWFYAALAMAFLLGATGGWLIVMTILSH